MTAGLYRIHQTLEELHELRRQVTEEAEITPESRALSLATIDKDISEWLDRSPEKVTSYVGLIRSREDTVAACKAERARIKAIEEAAEADIERLKENALATMQRFDIKELKATPGGGFRRQANGGVKPLEIAWPTYEDGSYKLVASPAGITWDLPVKLFAVPDTGAIREALKQRVVCKHCAGTGKRAQLSVEEFAACGIRGEDPGKCPRCNGDGTVPATVPGAKLLERGEHVRII
jgi:hypothetical protein